jgi:two-component system, NarL family, response regulator NreC
MITIVLADDHGVVRQALRALLESQPDFSILAEAGGGLEALAAIERHHPMVAVLDLMMPGLGGLEVTRRVSAQTRVVILSMHDSEAYVVEALRNGALGYVLKDSTAADLLQAVRAAAEGRRFLSAPLSERMIDRYLTRIKSGPLDPYETLTPREREVLQMAAEGLNTVEVSARLSISPRTVEIHRANVMHKLDLHTQTDLIRYAIKKGIISA